MPGRSVAALPVAGWFLNQWRTNRALDIFSTEKMKDSTGLFGHEKGRWINLIQRPFALPDAVISPDG